MVLHHQSLQRQILGYHGRIHGRMTSREGALLKGWHNKTYLWSTVSTVFAKCRSNAVSVCQSNVAACSSCYFCNFYTYEPQMANNVKVLSWNPIYDGNQTFQKSKLKAQKRCSKTGSKHCAAAEKSVGAEMKHHIKNLRYRALISCVWMSGRICGTSAGLIDKLHAIYLAVGSVAYSKESPGITRYFWIECELATVV